LGVLKGSRAEYREIFDQSYGTSRGRGSTGSEGHALLFSTIVAFFDRPQGRCAG
jgi:hypothetical protein